MKIFKATKLIPFVLMTIVFFTGCSSSEQKWEDIQTDLYTITNSEGGIYLNFQEGNDSASTGEESGSVCGDLTFESLGEMRRVFKNGELTESQIEIIKNAFLKDDKGILLCNFDRLYEPTVPIGISGKSVIYSGREEYAFMLTDSNSGMTVTFMNHSSDVYARRYASEYKNFLDNDRIEFIRKETESNRNATVYYYRTGVVEQKGVQYTIRTSGKTLHVYEEYLLKLYNPDLPSLRVSDTIPFRIRIFGQQGDTYFEVYCSRPETRPTVEWLSSFGLKLFTG